MTQHEPGHASTRTPVEELYTLPLQSFTPARNALAAALKKDGKNEEAEQVRSLGRPSLSAWTVNQLYWQERARFDELLDAGERFRTAQRAQFDGQPADLLGALDARREAVSALTRVAARVLHAAGHSPTTDMMRRVTSSLEAIATHGRGPDAPAHGRLMADVPPPGFEALAALVPRVGAQTTAGHGTRRVLTFGERSDDAAKPRGRTAAAEQMRVKDLAARWAQAGLALKAAERELRTARAAAQKARDTMKAAAAKATALERASATATARAEKAATAADTSRRAARKAAAEAEAAVQALHDAELTLERATERATSFKT